MDDLQEHAVPGPLGEAPGLTQWQRVGSIFSAPSRTFTDIQRGHRSWWLPFVLMIAASYLFFGAITLRIGWDQVAENAIHFNPKAEQRMAQATPERRATSMKITRYSMEGGFAASPLLMLGFLAVMSLGLWGTMNFVFGGKATYGSIFTVWMYAALPGTIKTLLGIVVIYAGMAPESFNLNNFAPTSVGAFLDPLSTNAALYTLASRLDFTSIWSLVLLGMGAATVSGLKRSSGYMAVFGWWILFLVIGVGWAAVMG